MNKETCEFLQACAEMAELDCVIHDDYSGRGMYGKETHGIELEQPFELLGAMFDYLTMLNFEEEGVDVTKIDLFGIRTDSMGHNTILY